MHYKSVLSQNLAKVINLPQSDKKMCLSHTLSETKQIRANISLFKPLPILKTSPYLKIYISLFTYVLYVNVDKFWKTVDHLFTALIPINREPQLVSEEDRLWPFIYLYMTGRNAYQYQLSVGKPAEKPLKCTNKDGVHIT